MCMTLLMYVDSALNHRVTQRYVNDVRLSPSKKKFFAPDGMTRQNLDVFETSTLQEDIIKWNLPFIEKWERKGSCLPLCGLKICMHVATTTMIHLCAKCKVKNTKYSIHWKGAACYSHQSSDRLNVWFDRIVWPNFNWLDQPKWQNLFLQNTEIFKVQWACVNIPKTILPKNSSKKKIQEKSKKYKQFPNSLILKIYSSLHRIWRPKTLSGLFFTTYCIFQNGYLRYFKLERKLKLFCGDNFRQN